MNYFKWRVDEVVIADPAGASATTPLRKDASSCHVKSEKVIDMSQGIKLELKGVAS